MTHPEPKRLGILLSGRGSNFLAIADAAYCGILEHKAEIAIVISNVAESDGLARARALELPTFLSVSKGRPRAEQEAEVIETLLQEEVDLVILAGYMRLLSPQFVARFPNQILNIHPSLLPAFPGLEAQKRTLDYGCKIAGCTVHFVDEHLDHGAIILQRTVPVLDSDDSNSLSARILVEEHIAYPEAIERVVSGQYRIEGRRYVRIPKE
jgi:phosphoribosylglycinamide formyltransferase-1